MKGICVIGNSVAATERMSNALLQLGIPLAAPSRQDPELTFGFWQEQMLAAQEEAAPGSGIEVSRAWEQLAGSLFLANRKTPYWQWAEPSSLPLLPYWHDFDPSILFLFAYESPQDYLSVRTGHWDASQSIHEFMASWVEQTQTMFRFYLRHPKRSLLLRSDLASDPEQLLSILTQSWDYALPSSPWDSPEEAALGRTVTADAQVRKFFSHMLLQDAPDILDLHTEVELSLQGLEDSEQVAEGPQASALDEAILFYNDEQSQRQSAIQNLQDTINQLVAIETKLIGEVAALSNSKTYLENQVVDQSNQLRHLKQSLIDAQETNEAYAAENDQLMALRLQQAQQLSAKDRLLSELQESLAGAKQSNAQLAEEKARLVATRDEYALQLEKLTSEYASKIEGKEKKLSEKEAAYNEISEENSLLLEQLHQVQEELESYFIKCEEYRKKNEEISAQLEKNQQESVKRVADLDAQLKQATQALVEANKAKDVLTAEKAQLASAQAEQAKQLVERDAKLQQIAQALAESNKAKDALAAEKTQLARTQSDQTKQIAERDAKLQQLTQVLAEANKAKDALSAEKSQLLSERDERSTELSALKKEYADTVEKKEKEISAKESQCKEISEENDLLLSQLHMVQEELEEYFLKYQESRTNLEDVSQSLEKLQNAYPEHFTCDAIQVSEAPDGRGKKLLWELTNVVSGRRKFPVISLESQIVRKQLKISFTRESTHSTSSLIRWPTEDSNSLTFQLPGTPKEQLAIATSDWYLLKGVLSAMSQWIVKPHSGLPESVDLTLIGSELSALLKKIQANRSSFRFDGFTFEQSLNPPNYDSLSVRLKNLILDDQYWPELRFQLATVYKSESDFGANPRLEFSQESASIIENWFATDNDQRGERLELRFAKPNKMDTKVFNSLSPNDQILLVNVILLLPEHLSLAPEIDGLKTSKEKWLTLTEGMRDTLLTEIKRSANAELEVS